MLEILHQWEGVLLLNLLSFSVPFTLFLFPSSSVLIMFYTLFIQCFGKCFDATVYIKTFLCTSSYEPAFSCIAKTLHKNKKSPKQNLEVNLDGSMQLRAYPKNN